MVKHALLQNGVPFMVLCFHRINFAGHCIIYGHIPCSTDTDAEFFLPWKILIFLTFLQFVDNNAGIGNFFRAVYMAEEQPSVFAFFPHLINQIRGRFSVGLQNLYISCVLYCLQKTVFAECYSLTFFCQFCSTVRRIGIRIFRKLSRKDYAAASGFEFFQNFQCGITKRQAVGNKNRIVFHSANFQKVFILLALIQIRKQRL